MKIDFASRACGRCLCAAIALGLWWLPLPARSNPVGGTPVQGSATFATQGSQFIIRTSDRAQINWSSFNIGVGETTTFIQPSASSVVWNRIDGSSASQLLGNLNANGYVVLQNASGFYIGGQAVLTAHGLLMTTAPTPVPDLSGGGAWQFNALPPMASIINYGQLRQPDGDKGGSVFLIAADIQNNGTISAPQGNIGLYAGKEVLVSARPDGRGLSAKVTLPQGSVNNQGQVISDAGIIAMQAAVVNQGGLVQANSVRNVNGVIELFASESLNIEAGSSLSAQGDATSSSASQGGFVVVKSAKTFTDTPTSTIDVSGKNNGRDGVVEVFGTGVTRATVHSSIDELSAANFQDAGGLLLVNPQNLSLSTAASTPSAASPNLRLSDLSSYSRIDLFAMNNIKLSAGWNLADSADADARLSLSAGNSVTFLAGLAAGNNWSVDLSAGSRGLDAKPNAGDGIYFNGDAFLRTQNGSIDLWAANEVIVNPALSTLSGVRTLKGGSIDVVAEFGNVNTGGNYSGFDFGSISHSDTTLYRASQNLGGISTAHGGNVSITAGGDVISYLPSQTDYNHALNDAGTGAFGSEPGNVSIVAGGKVSGHYVLVNGSGSITAGGDVGSPTASGGFALSLVKGDWNVSAPSGSIFVQDIRNPNGVFNDVGSYSTYRGYHRFDYDPLASVSLEAANKVELTGAGAPHLLPSEASIPMLFPPTLHVKAGPGGFVLDTDATLFPSPKGELTIVSGGNFESYEDPETPDVINTHTLSMSDSAAVQWDPEADIATFGLNDHSSTPPELNNRNPVQVSISGSIRNVTLRTTKATHITVDGDTQNFGFLGQNLHADDVTSIDVAGAISYPPVYTFTPLSGSIQSPNTTFSTSWDAIFSLLIDPTMSLQLTAEVLAMTPQQRTAYAYSHLRLTLRESYTLQAGYDANANPGFIYDALTGSLGYRYQMSQAVFNALNKASIPILKLDQQGNVEVERDAAGNYFFATTSASFIDPAKLGHLYAPPETPVKNSQHLSPGFQIGGPGQFNISAGTLDLGSSGGIVSWGVSIDFNPINYGTLAPWTPAGAAVNVDVRGDISLLTSTIASIYGGDVKVNSGGGVFLSQGNFSLIPPGAAMTYGIFTAGNSDVKVTAQQDIDVGGARIAAFNGGDVFVRSEHGNVNAGNGANSLLVVPVIRRDPVTGELVSDQIQDPRPFGSGIIAIAPAGDYQVPGASGLPGNITVETPYGDIVSTLGGIQQFALNGNVAGGPSITLSAGTPGSDGHPGFAGNVDLGQGGVVGGTINISAQGSIKGLIVSRQNANINAAQSFSGTLLSGGTANVSASAGSVSGTVIGVGGVNASGGGGVTASVLGQNVSIGGGAAQSTLGTSASATSTSQAAATQASSDAKQQLTSDASQESEEQKKRNSRSPVLVKRVGRVTVILPGS